MVTSRRVFFLILLFIALLSLPVYSQTGTVTDTTLGNGIKVIVREGHSINLVAIDLWVRGGTVNETATNNGISHMVEHMVFKSTKKFGPGGIDRQIEGMGAEINGATSRDGAHFFTTVRSDYLPAALDVLSEAVTSALFRQEDIDKERQVVIDEIARADSDPYKCVLDLFNSAAYGGNSYGLPVAGTKDIVSKLSRDELYSYYKKYYTPSNMCIAISGDVTTNEALNAVRKCFDTFAGTGVSAKSASPMVAVKRTKPEVRRYSADWDQAYVILGFSAPSASEFREACAMDVMLSILGDTERGRLASALAASKIRFSQISPDFVLQRYPSMFYVCVAVNPADAGKAASVVLGELRRFCGEAVSSDEFLTARSRVEGSDLYDQETFSGQARALGLYDILGDANMALTYGETVRSLTAADIQSTAVKYFSKDDYCLVGVGPVQNESDTNTAGAAAGQKK